MSPTNNTADRLFAGVVTHANLAAVARLTAQAEPSSDHHVRSVLRSLSDGAELTAGCSLAGATTSLAGDLVTRLVQNPSRAAEVFALTDGRSSAQLARIMCTRADDGEVVPYQMWSAAAGCGQLDAVTALRILNSIFDAAGFTDTQRVGISTAVVNGPVADRHIRLTSDMVSTPETAASVFAFSTVREHQDVALHALRTSASASAAPAWLLTPMVDALIGRVTTGATGSELATLVHVASALCDEHTYLCFTQRPRIAAAFDSRARELTTGADVDVADQLITTAAAKQFSLDTYVDQNETVHQVVDLMGFASSDSPQDHDLVVRVARLTQNVSRDTTVEAMLARLLALNPAVPDSVLTSLVSSRIGKHLGDVVLDRAQLSSELAVCCEYKFGFRSSRFIERCDDPPAAVALLANNSFRSVSFSSQMFDKLVERGVWEHIDVAQLRVDVFESLVHKSIEAPIMVWVGEHLCSSTQRWAFTSQLINGFDGTFGDIEALCDAAQL